MLTVPELVKKAGKYSALLAHFVTTHASFGASDRGSPELGGQLATLAETMLGCKGGGCWLLTQVSFVS